MTYSLPHELDREYQQEVFDWIMKSDKKYLILCAPTGFGKSPLPAASSLTHRVLTLVLHKSLQLANYREQYNFDILFGKSNYPCTNKKRKLPAKIKFTAYDCGNPDCNCPYQQMETHCLQSKHVCLNYAKHLSSRSFALAMQPDILYLDEAHNLPDIVMNHAGLSLDWTNEFAKLNGSIRPTSEMRLNYNEAMALFRQYARAVKNNKPEQKKDLAKWRKWKRLSQRIDVTNRLLTGGGELGQWYYESTHKSLIIKPLTAKYHFRRLFDVAPKTVLMSATITPNIIERLGLDENDCDFMEVPNVWPIPTRLIYDLGGPAINYRSSEADKQIHAELIAGMLTENKSGIIHVMSKNQAFELSSKLKYLCPELNFHVPSIGIGTDNQFREWCDRRNSGIYCISWNFHEGVDLGEDHINITAKVPYTSLGSNYERAKQEYDQQWYLIKTAYKFMQTCGRNRRGILEHYAPNARQVYIADSAWHRLKSLLPNDFVRSIRNWNGR